MAAAVSRLPVPGTTVATDDRKGVPCQPPGPADNARKVARRMNKLLRINPAFPAIAGAVALIVAGVLLGGFATTRSNGSTV